MPCNAAIESLTHGADINPHQKMTRDDFVRLRSCANELNFDTFVGHFGGHRVDALHKNLDFQNADYVFPSSKVIIELKIIETEIHNTEQFNQKMAVFYRSVHAKHGKMQMTLNAAEKVEGVKTFINLFRPPLARIAKKANAQIKSTKKYLPYADYSGIMLLVNDSLEELPPELVLRTLGRILNGSCSSIRAVIYLTNHYIFIPGDEYARILWAPLYADSSDSLLSDFINRLGSAWFDYCDKIGVPCGDKQIKADCSLAGSQAAGATLFVRD